MNQSRGIADRSQENMCPEVVNFSAIVSFVDALHLMDGTQFAEYLPFPLKQLASKVCFDPLLH